MCTQKVGKNVHKIIKSDFKWSKKSSVYLDKEKKARYRSIKKQSWDQNGYKTKLWSYSVNQVWTSFPYQILKATNNLYKGDNLWVE